MKQISLKKIRRALILGAVWGFISSCVIFPEVDLSNLISFLQEYINLVRERCQPDIPLGDHFPPPWIGIQYLVSLIVFFPAVPFHSLGLLGIFLAMLTGAAIRVIVELFLEMRRSKRKNTAE